jgi:hypothetical protein
MICIGSDSKDNWNAIMWDVRRDVEQALFDIEKDSYQLFWDSKGSPYITQDDKTIIADQGVTVKFYDVAEVNQRNIDRLNRS